MKTLNDFTIVCMTMAFVDLAYCHTTPNEALMLGALAGSGAIARAIWRWRSASRA